MFFKKAPQVTVSTVYDEQPRRFNLTQNIYDFWIGIEDSSFAYFIDPTIYNVEATLISRIGEEVNGEHVSNNSRTVLKMHACSNEANFKTKFSSLFRNDDLDNILCLDSSDEFNQ